MTAADDEELEHKMSVAQILSDHVFGYCMDFTEGDVAMVGSVLTLATARVLALLDDEVAVKAADKNRNMALDFRAVLRARPH